MEYIGNNALRFSRMVITNYTIPSSESI